MNNTSTQADSNLCNVEDVEERKYRCPVCGYYTLDESMGNDICPVCFWEDDWPAEYADEESPANGISISRARENWHRVGACDPDVLRFCRKPLPSEMPEIYEHEADDDGDDFDDRWDAEFGKYIGTPLPNEEFDEFMNKVLEFKKI